VVDVKPWERQRDSDGRLEPRHWYERFTNFRLQGPDRSLLAVYRYWKAQGGAGARDVTYVAKAWEQAAEKWRWQERARAWDAERTKRTTATQDQGGMALAATKGKPWERQPWETSAGFRAFHEFYLPQKPPRSVDEAYRNCYAQHYGLQHDEIRVAKKRASGTWRNWSRGNRGYNGRPIKDATSWAKRVGAWDDYQAVLDCRRWEEEHLQETGRRYDIIEQQRKAILKSIDPNEFTSDDWVEFLKWFYFGEGGGGLVEFILRLRAAREISDEMRIAIFARDNYTCRYCGRRMDLTIDHVFPKSRGGKATEDNLVTCCNHCNSTKWARTPEEAGMVLSG